MSSFTKRIAGVGSPIVDLLSHVSDAFIREYAGLKGGMELVDQATMEQLLSRLDEFPKPAAGGSAANTIFALARLGLSCGFVGKLGDDAPGKEYLNHFETYGGQTAGFKYCRQEATARCLSLVTPDYERTMRTCLGAAANLQPADIQVKDFEGFALVHIEGYLLFNRELIETVLKRAAEAGCQISLDLGSFEIVEALREPIAELLNHYVDIVFANEEEAFAFAQVKDRKQALQALHRHCPVAVVKLGAEGALIQSLESTVPVAAVPVETMVDTTGAGDFWAAGFLYGYLHDKPLSFCGQLGSILGAAVVQQLGADLPEEHWSSVTKQFENTLL